MWQFIVQSGKELITSLFTAFICTHRISARWNANSAYSSVKLKIAHCLISFITKLYYIWITIFNLSTILLPVLTYAFRNELHTFLIAKCCKVHIGISYRFQFSQSDSVKMKEISRSFSNRILSSSKINLAWRYDSFNSFPNIKREKCGEEKSGNPFSFRLGAEPPRHRT